MVDLWVVVCLFVCLVGWLVGYVARHVTESNNKQTNKQMNTELWCKSYSDAIQSRKYIRVMKIQSSNFVTRSTPELGNLGKVAAFQNGLSSDTTENSTTSVLWAILWALPPHKNANTSNHLLRQSRLLTSVRYLKTCIREPPTERIQLERFQCLSSARHTCTD